MRVSLDTITNSHGIKLLDLCKSRPTSLRLANGRLQHDKQIGSYTYCNKQGASVIDYLLLSENDFNRIRPCLGRPCVETELAATGKSATDGD